MQQLYKILTLNFLCLLLGSFAASAQVTLKGKVVDNETGEELIGATIQIVAGGSGGANTNYEGEFALRVDALPVTLKVAYTGYTTKEVQVTTADKFTIKLVTAELILEETVVKGQRIDDKQKAAPLTVENLDAIAIKETPAISFYNGLGNLKGVDLTTASMGFTVINMRGFNSTSPVRSLQIIDGVDNQAPGLNFSLGNFLGCSELDVNRVELVAGASGPFYGPNAFNGVISIESKNPFIQKGLSVLAKGGERNLFEGAIRWAQGVKNKDGKDFFAYKLNFYHLRANDWVADNYDPVYGTQTGKDNPGRYDAVNIYGDEYNPGYNLTGESPWASEYGLGIYHRTGYKEEDIVDYGTRNYKANAALHFRLNPNKEFESPEFIVSSSFGSGTTVYQGDNRFSLRNILFFQNRLELRKKDKFFIRAYATNEDAGDSYDPYATALLLQQSAESNDVWRGDYKTYWNSVGKYADRMKALGYPQLKTYYDPVTMTVVSEFDYAKAEEWFRTYNDTLKVWHGLAALYADRKSPDPTKISNDFLRPGTAEFQQEFDRLTTTKSGASGGTRFFDKSALYHTHGEYRFTPKRLSYWVVGGNVRLYRPISEGTIFSDTLTYTRNSSGVATDSVYRKITNNEFGLYTGIEKKFANDRFIFTGTVRADKNQNFNLLLTPAASLVYNPSPNHYLRFSFSSAIRNPTLTDQYLNLNVGRAILLGNLNGFNDLITISSFQEALKNPLAIEVAKFKYFDVAPIRPEKVKTFELGYRATLFNQLYMDAGYYFNIYDDFIGYNIGLTVPVSSGFVDLPKLQVYRVAANSTNQVTTQGFSIGLNYYFWDFYQLSGNYSWNKLNKNFEDDPIIPAFNTPEHKYNISISGRDIRIGRLKQTGFNVTYKWVQGFLFEGSPQFTGFIPSYDMVDAQWNCTVRRWHTTFKIGATNILNNKQFQTYGGPRIGRMAYISMTYSFDPGRK